MTNEPGHRSVRSGGESGSRLGGGVEPSAQYSSWVGGRWPRHAQPPGYSPMRDTISALAALGARDRWLMTSALAGLGTSHIITALGLRPA